MFFVFDRRRVWVRTVTHTVVFDSEPDFERFRDDPTGHVEGFLHVWLADDVRKPMGELAYLGGVSLRPGRKLASGQVRRILTSLRRAAGVNAARLESRLVRHFSAFLAETPARGPTGRRRTASAGAR